MGAVAMIACEDPATPSKDGGTGQGGAGGCPAGPQPLFTLTVTAEGGPVPADTSVRVTWSVGEEPAFVLGDPSTWKTLDDNVNVVCNVDHGQPPPKDLKALVCQLWTTGATEVEVAATGFQTHDETFTPKQIDECDKPIPSDVAIALLPELDAGGS